MLAPLIAAKRCATSQIVLFDFLAPRLLSSAIGGRPSHPKRPIVPSTRRSSTSALNIARPHKSITFQSIGDADPVEVNLDLASIQEAARENDLLRVWKHYRRLEGDGLLRILGPPHLGPISRMIIAICDRADTGVEWVEDERLAMEELALTCATGGFVEGLRHIILRCLRKRDAESVVNIYDEYFMRTQSSQADLEAHIPVNMPMSDHGSAINLGNDSRPDKGESIHINHSHILVAVIAAHALRGSFEDALDVGLRRLPIRVVPQHVKELFQELKTSHNFEGRTMAFCEAVGTAALAQRPEAFKVHVRNMTEQKAVGRLQRLANAMVAGFDGPLPWAALEKPDVSRSRPVLISDKIWGYLIQSFICLQREDIAEALWAKVTGNGVRPGVAMWNALLEGYRETGQLPKLLSAWEAMKKAGVAPGPSSYAAKIICLNQKALPAAALQTFEEFKVNVPKSADNVFVHNSVLDGLLSKTEEASAKKLLDEMIADGPAPDTVTFNTFLKFYGRKGDMKRVAAVIHQLMANNAQPDVVTFTTILSTMLKSGVPNATGRLLEVMKSTGVEQNVATYSAIIDAQARSGTKEGIRSAWELLHKMESLKNAQPNEITYTAFLCGVHRSSELDQELIDSISSDIADKMEKRGVRLKRGTYHILLKACLENPKPEGLASFIGYYNAMMRKKVTFSHDTWYIILRGLLKRNEWALASEMVDQMLKSEFQPMWGVEDMMVRVLRWKSANKQ